MLKKIYFNYLSTQNHFPTTFKFLKCILVYPDFVGKKRILYIILSTLHFFYFPIFFMAEELIYIYLNPDGYIEAVKSFGTVCYHFAASIRTIHFFFTFNKYEEFNKRINRKSFFFKDFYFKDLAKINKPEFLEFNYKLNYVNIKNSWKKYASFHHFQTDSSEELDKVKDELLTGANTFTRSLFILMFFGGMLSLQSSYAYSVFGTVKKYYDNETNSILIKDEIPYKSWHLLDLNIVLDYKIESIYSFYVITYLTVCYLAIDSLLFVSIQSLTTQLKMLNIIIRKIKIRPKDKIQERIATAQLVKCIEELNEILRYYLY